MLRAISRLAFASSIFLLLRPRWKWLAPCVGLAVLAEYFYGELVEHVQLLASVGEGDAIVGSLSTFFALKNVALVGLLVVYIGFEVRLAKRNREGASTGGGARKAERGFSAAEGSGLREDNLRGKGGHPEASDGQNKRPPAAADGDDGFDFLRHGHKLRTRSEKIMGRE